MTEEQLQAFASNLRRPDGEFGKIVGQRMNDGNRWINEHTIEILQPSTGDNILEIGMGNGYFVKDIFSKAEGITYTGCDFSPTMIEECERLNAELIQKGNVRFVLGEADHLPFPDNTFNKLFTVNTLYFWADPAITLAEFHRVLEPDGELIISIRPKSTMENLPIVKYGFNTFTRDEVIALLSAHSFTVTGHVERTEPEQNLGNEMIRMETLIIKSKR